MQVFDVNLLSKLITLCGILGIWARNKTGELQFGHMPLALSKLAHRGPDCQASKIWSNVALGHARLSIIDLTESANQPFTDSTGRYHLVFNGEIYNYQELRLKLVNLGVAFKTQSDTEVLLNWLIHNGESGIADLNGFFAFIFFDAHEQVLLAARDRLGIKPLLYAVSENEIILASELKPFLAFGIDKTIDQDALSQYFAYTYVPAPRTILSSVRKLMPGELLRIVGNQLEFKTYYRVEAQPLFTGSYEAAKSQLYTLLNKSVERRLIADVPVGSFLSGGLDSSIIAAIAKTQKEDLRTFSIGFDHPYFNESEYAVEMSKHIGTRHETLILDKIRFKAAFVPFLQALDEPFADSSAFAVYLLSQATRKQVTVSLSGDGADELFGGYRKHLADVRLRTTGPIKKKLIRMGAKVVGKGSASRSSKTGDLKRKLSKFADAIDFSAEERYEAWCQWISPEDRTNLLMKKGNLFPWQEPITGINDFLLRDQQFVLPNDMLKKVDLMSMAHALEVRVPFLDHELVEFANALPADWKVDTKRTKIILRDTFAKQLPESILKRSKKGFEIPLQSWLQDEMDLLFSSRLFSREFLQRQGLFHPEFIGNIRSEWKQGRVGERIYLVWALLVFQHWYEENIDKA